MSQSPIPKAVHTKSRDLFARAEKSIPGGVNSPARAFRSVGGDPVFIERGEALTSTMSMETPTLISSDRGGHCCWDIATRP